MKTSASVRLCIVSLVLLVLSGRASGQAAVDFVITVLGGSGATGAVYIPGTFPLDVCTLATSGCIALLVSGDGYVIQAIPGPGSVFAGWSNVVGQAVTCGGSTYPGSACGCPPPGCVWVWMQCIGLCGITATFVPQAPGTIATAAGNGTPGYSGDGSLAGPGNTGPATNAELNWPWGVSVDPSGNIYLADAQNNRVRRVATSTDVITTVAGNGTAGYSGDGGLATSAELGYPTGLGLDSAGNIYIASSGSRFCVIRKVTASTGIITTIAGSTCGYGGDGGPATSAYLTFTSGMAVDSAGDLYIVQYQAPVRRAPPTACAIRKVTASTGIITTIAGGETCGYSGDGGPATSAELSELAGVAVDSSGNVYIGDGGNNRVRMVNASTGIITTVAGNGTAGYLGDGGPAVDAELNFPAGLAVDSAGDIYFSNADNSVIRKVSASTGVITTVAGNGLSGYSGDGGPATGAELAYPEDVALDSFNNLYISDTDNNRIRQVWH